MSELSCETLQCPYLHVFKTYSGAAAHSQQRVHLQPFCFNSTVQCLCSERCHSMEKGEKMSESIGYGWHVYITRANKFLWLYCRVRSEFGLHAFTWQTKARGSCFSHSQWRADGCTLRVWFHMYEQRLIYGGLTLTTLLKVLTSANQTKSLTGFPSLYWNAKSRRRYNFTSI